MNNLRKLVDRWGKEQQERVQNKWSQTQREQYLVEIRQLVGPALVKKRNVFLF